MGTIFDSDPESPDSPPFEGYVLYPESISPKSDISDKDSYEGLIFKKNPFTVPKIFEKIGKGYRVIPIEVSVVYCLFKKLGEFEPVYTVVHKNQEYSLNEVFGFTEADVYTGRNRFSSSSTDTYSKLYASDHDAYIVDWDL